MPSLRGNHEKAEDCSDLATSIHRTPGITLSHRILTWIVILSDISNSVGAYSLARLASLRTRHVRIAAIIIFRRSTAFLLLLLLLLLRHFYCKCVSVDGAASGQSAPSADREGGGGGRRRREKAMDGRMDG